MSRNDELLVVPGERHVDSVVRAGGHAETRSSLRNRLATALLPNVRLVDAAECRLVLGFVLGATDTPMRKQLALFDAVDDVEERPDAVAAAHLRGGRAWVRIVSAIDRAIGALRARRTGVAELDRATRKDSGVTAERARLLRNAIQAMDDALAAAGACDARSVGPRLAEAVERVSSDALAEIIGCSRLRTRWIVRWDPADLVWWRALDEKMSPVGGWARVTLPTFDRPLAGDRERDALEALSDEVAAGLDGAPETEPIAPVFGDLTARPSPVARERVTIIQAPDRVAQARAAAEAIRRAITHGVSVDRVALAVSATDDDVALAPIQRALLSEGIVAFDARGSSVSGTPAVELAFAAFEAAHALDRRALAHLLRSVYVDPSRLAPAAGAYEGRRTMLSVARVLENTPTATGDDPRARIVRTVVAGGGDASIAERLLDLLASVQPNDTRQGFARTARTLWTSLGIGDAAGRGGLSAFTSDAAPNGVARAERLAVARDARGWETLLSALDRYERWASDVGVVRRRIDSDTFCAELRELVDSLAITPSAARAGAVRIARIGELAGEDLDLLVIVDANAGLFPVAAGAEGLFTDALARAAGRGSLVPPSRVRETTELAAIAVAVGCARRVVVCFADEDAAGAPLIPAPLVDALIRGGLAVERAARAPLPVPPEEAVLRARREAEREAFFLDASRPRSDVIGELCTESAALPILTRETGATWPLAVTSLERFARCPFMGYAHTILGARDAADGRELPDAREEGSLIHEALAAAFAENAQQWARRPRDRVAILARGRAAADVVLTKWQAHAPLRQLTKLRVLDVVGRLLEAAVDDEDWDFALAEQSFGGRESDGETWPPLELRKPSGVYARLRGTIDRVDLAHDGTAVRVVDYKRTDTTARAASADAGESTLQVPLYASVASRRYRLRATGIYVGAQSRSIPSDAQRERRSAGDRIEELAARDLMRVESIAPVEQRALDVLEGIRAGRLAPLPADETICRSCSFSGGCRKPRFAMSPEDAVDEETR